ncbi:MAG: Lrp/AsnC family transcriptional regulator [Melioribacteraceae bacterium]|nr:Lrp/AsnC family transcriptional regulator [Melioribacteraceae bacterium]MCF8356120.1 Lrp/AsnC family transcriptional regulator [Melioribacteraceae bacterium]MCF8395902.1 Lrp/AsnC family transcriptional regulator [Melioribacteraceae bacterium]MCF8420992.1 Lrp/AsnC family transcriptional regulator [Melioribacteraceae bacterium]
MLDDIDIKILNMLQENGRTKRNQLAEAVGLSLPSLSERLKKLEDHKVIEGYYTKLDRKIFGFDIMAFILVVMDSSKNYSSLTDKVSETPEILECHSILGEGSHIMKALVEDSAALEKLLGKIQSWPGVTRTITSFVLSTIKETTNINIKSKKEK